MAARPCTAETLNRSEFPQVSAIPLEAGFFRFGGALLRMPINGKKVSPHN
jgi:hypothetical protein